MQIPPASAEVIKRCPRCGFDRNTEKDEKCNNCGHTLLASKNREDKAPVLSGLILLLIVLALPIFILPVALFTLKHNTPSSSASKSSIPTTPPQIDIPASLTTYNSIADVPEVPQGNFSYSGTSQFAALRPQLSEAIATAHPKFLLMYVQPSTSNVLQMLLAGQIDFAQTDWPLSQQEIAQARARHVQLQQIRVGLDVPVFFAKKGFPVSGLSLEQLRQIYSGRITNWEQVDGPPVKITPITIGSDRQMMKMLGVDRPKAYQARDCTEAIRQTANNVGAISYCSAPLVMGQSTIASLPIAGGNSKQYVSALTTDGKLDRKAVLNGSYPLSQRIFLVIRNDGTREWLAAVAFADMLLSIQGQQLLKKAGFIPGAEF